MLVSGGKIIAIDEIKTTSATLSGDGIWTELGLNTSATIDPIKNDISSLSSTITNISSDLTNLSGTVNSIREDVDNVSSKVDETYEYITELANDIDFISGELDKETTARQADIKAIEADIDVLSAEIRTKQKQLSAGDYIEILNGDEYDTISVTGLNEGDTTYFNAQYNRHSSTEYFTFDGNTLSASPEIGYFNLSIKYKVNTNSACVDNYYSASILCNNTVIDSHYINGAIPSETHYISQNVLNDAENNLYTFTFNKENELNISDMNINCIGFICEANNIDIGVLGNNGAILTFGNTVLRV